MVKEPNSWVEKSLSGGADRIIGQIEMMDSQEEFVKNVVGAGVGVGLALDIDTPVEEIVEDVMSYLDVVLVMSVPAGFGGQEFDRRALEKIEKLKGLKNSYKYSICVDGGINLSNIGEVVTAGADEVCVGKRLYKGDLRSNIKKLIKATN